MNEEVICVIGMHRSGTSLTTRVLNLCGLDLGPSDQLMGPHESNPEGHWENLAFFSINESLLSRFGGSWDNPPLLKKGWEADPDLKSIVQDAKRHVNGFSARAPWGWKDPRSTILLPFWRSLIPNLRFVICVRNPLEVARSLARRDQMPIQKGLHLWNHYMHAAIRETEDAPRTFVFFEDFFKDPFSEIGHLAGFCGLKMPENSALLLQSISRELKHHSIETADLLDETALVVEYKLFYIGLRSLSVRSLVSSTPARMREEVISENIGRFLRLVERFHDNNDYKDVQLFRLCTAMLGLQQKMTSKIQENVQLTSMVAELNRQLSEVLHSHSWRLTKPLRLLVSHLHRVVEKVRGRSGFQAFEENLSNSGVTKGGEGHPI